MVTLMGAAMVYWKRNESCAEDHITGRGCLDSAGNLVSQMSSAGQKKLRFHGS